VKKMQKPFAGKAYGPIILILKSHKDDKGLEEHEKVHVRQWWKHGLIINSLLYRFSRKYRYKSEVEAYAKQAEYNPQHVGLFAAYIINNYNLKLDPIKDMQDVINDIQEYA
jgi:hypothetical protein